MISHEYGAHSALVDMIMTAVDVHDGIDKGHDYDNKIRKYLDNLYWDYFFLILKIKKI